jgi:2-methylcitrate dehydratase PrpD
MKSMKVTEELVTFIKKSNDRDFDDHILLEAKKCILDGIAVTLAGSRHEAVKVIKNYVSEIGGKAQATTIGMDSVRASVVHAALVNGVASHVLDFDDTQNILGGHPTAVVLPVVLAVGEYKKASGKDVLTAFILGTEVSCKIGRGVNPYHYQSGYHVTSTIGIFGAVASAGKLLNLSQEDFLSAFGIAGSMSSGLKENFGTMTKSLHVGLAASNGTMAALLAQKGYTASEKILEGEMGFGRVLSKDCRFDNIIKNLGDPWEIENPGITRKKYPSCARTHSAIDALLKIMGRHPIHDEDLEEIECATDDTAFEILIHPTPKTPLEAKFSMPYCLAVAFLEKGVSIHHFDLERMKEPIIVNTMRKVRHIRDEKIIAKGFEHRGTSRVKVRLVNGEEFTEEVEKSKGHPENPLIYEEIVDKFRQCASGILSTPRIDSIIHKIDHLEDEREVSYLLNDLALNKPA